ncbi:50S ribosomal protein L16 3-hydroxylase [Halioglobus japonicus]|nr:50S ribosomal protein L16 3-hydroxylase [Halioglobus japonicus]
MSGNWQLNLDRDVFLNEYWQRKPLLIRNGSAGFTPPLGSDHLAGLALEDDVESRLIEKRDDGWQLHHGPFSTADFSRDHPWTLLVQAVDHYFPEVAELQRLFDFIPRWRMDDVMVSYAVDGGSAGPHYDNYDVFLLQGEGQRLWRVGQHCDSNTALLPHQDMRLLQDFETQEEFLLDPGDILYVPPGIAHWGIAVGECTTFSIGFRAPTINDLVSRWTDELLLQTDDERFYRDAGRAPCTRAGEIESADVERALSQVRRALEQNVDSQWFGELVTEPRYDSEPDPDEQEQASTLLHNGAASVSLHPAAKLAWQEGEDEVTVFANGEGFACQPSALASLLILCNRQCLTGGTLDKALADSDTASMLERLIQSGCLHVE